MTRITHNVAFWLALCGICSFGAVYWVLGPQHTANLSVSLPLVTAFFLGLRLTGTAVHIARGKLQDQGAILMFGIWVFCVGLVEYLAFVLIYRYLGRPPWLLNSAFNPIGPWTVFWGLAIILLAPGTIKGSIPWGNVIYVIIAAFGGGMLTMAMIFFIVTQAPDLSLSEPIKVPGVGAVICTESQPVRVHAYCRAKPQIFDPLKIR